MSETSPPTGSGSSRYRTLFELAQGGTAIVSLAVARGAEGPGPLVVVKQLRPIYVGDADFRAMFMTEGRLSAQLEHPHIVRTLEVLEESAPTIVMEYIEGQTLDAVLALGEPPLPLELHLRILADALSGLHHSHELVDASGAPLEVVHRDVSPQNVMVGYDGVVKVLDFGVAQLAGTTIETETGVVKGKLRYMPPEQVAGDEVDRRADVFAVGVMLWEALSGSRLWKGMPDAAIMNRVLAGAIPEPKREGEATCPELSAICRRALAPQRGERYSTARQFQVALEDYIARRWPSASTHDLSRFMNERFAGAREEAAERVRQELGRVEVPTRSRRPTLPKRRTMRSVDAPVAKAEPPKVARRSPSWWLALVSVLLGALLFAWGVRAKREKSPIAPGPQPPAVDAKARDQVAPARQRPEPEPEPEPAVATAPAPSASAAPRPVVAPPSSAAPPRSRVAPPPSPSAEEPPPSEDGCEPPYYYVSGIKKFKPECL